MEEIKLDTTSQIVIGLIIIMIIGLLINGRMGSFGRMYERVSERNFIGLVQKKEIDYDNHAVRVVYIGSTNREGRMTVNSEFYESISVGDSISKRAGDMVVHLYKKDGRYLYFDYDEYYSTYFTKEYNKYMKKMNKP